jgi:lipid-binding SYLF domain-containing protein
MQMRKMICVAATVLASAVMLDAAVTKTQAERLHDAAMVLQEIHRAPDRDIPDGLWEKAACVAVFPSVKKAAFLVGGEFGKGVMSCRNGAMWSAPTFMTLEKGSFGLQFGGEAVDLVLLVMNEHGVNRLLQDKVSLGGEASVAGGPVGRSASAMTDSQLKAEILSYSRSQGLFAGFDLTGGVIKADQADNRDLYGRELSTRDILIGRVVPPPHAAAEFESALKRTMPTAG